MEAVAIFLGLLVMFAIGFYMGKVWGAQSVPIQVVVPPSPPQVIYAPPPTQVHQQYYHDPYQQAISRPIGFRMER